MNLAIVNQNLIGLISLTKEGIQKSIWVDMKGGRGLKCPKIGDVVYGWPLRDFIQKEINIVI